MEIKNIALPLFLAIIGFGFGVFFGMVYPVQIPGIVLQNDNKQVTDQIINKLNSKVIPSVAAYGTVTKINGKSITLSYQEDNLVVLVKDDAKIYTFVKEAGKTSSVSKLIGFGDIKVGDNVTANIKILSDGQIQGVSVIVLPPASISPAE